jgi:Trk-type K+ transport system membrane component
VRPPSIEVWVIVDDQYPDAVELLKNPEHEVSKPSTQREMELMEKLEDNEYSPATVSIIKFATMIFFGTIALCVIAYWLRSR